MALIFGTGNNDNPLNGTLGGDVIDGQGGDDTIWGDQQGGGDLVGERDTIFGGAGNDTIRGQGGDDDIYGDVGAAVGMNDGDDVLYGGAGNDRLFGGLGSNELYGGDGDDSLSSIDGYLRALGDKDVLDGGAGEGDLAFIQRFSNSDGSLNTIAETVDFSLASTATGVTLSDGTEIRNIERVTFQAGFGNDVIVGTNYNQGLNTDELFGGGGNDTIDGLDGGDFIQGGAGSDTLFGGDGADYIETGDSDSLATDVDVAHGDAGNDTLFGYTIGQEVMYGDDGDDTLISAGPEDQLYGGNGDDQIEWEYVAPGAGVGTARLLPRADAALSDDVGMDMLSVEQRFSMVAQEQTGSRSTSTKAALAST